jgi:hypothetical protein
MDKNPTPGVPGQIIAPEIFTEILAAIRTLGSRMESLEGRLEGLDRNVLDAINADDAAANVGGRIIARSKKRDKPGESGDE